MYSVLIRACGGAVGTTHELRTAEELEAFLAGVDAAVTLQEAEVVVHERGWQIERRLVGSDRAAREAGAWVHLRHKGAA